MFFDKRKGKFYLKRVVTVSVWKKCIKMGPKNQDIMFWMDSVGSK